jgi:predicted metal-dependent phosphoesterase TrpH
VERAREIARRLADMHAPIDVDALLQSTGSSGKAIARPQIAQSLVDAGHAASVADAFARYLDERSPAYVPHQGISPAAIIPIVARHGGVTSMAHPGRLRRDELIPSLVDAGLPCIEAYHSSHDAADQARYIAFARRYRLAISGGSDFHGDGTRAASAFGVVGLPPSEYDHFRAVLHDATLQRTSR